MSFGVTATGFNRKRVEDIRPELEEDFKSIFGADLDVSETSNAGALIDMLTRKLAAIWEGMETQYNSRDVNGTEDVSLDRLCAEVGVYREGQTSTSVQGNLFGDDGTVIVLGKLVSQDITNEEFEITASTTISALTCISSYFSVDTVTDSVSYTVTIDSVNYTINSGVGATAISIIAALKVDVDAASLDVIFTDNLDGSALITSTDGVTSYSIALSALLVLGQLSVLGQFSAINTGPISVPIATINTIVTSVAGWDSVSNTQAGVTGRDTETNEEVRLRRTLALLSVGAGTDPAIESNLLNEVDNVTSVKVISNRTNGTVDSRPAKSFEAIVTGGTDLAVAEKIWEVQPSGIESYGNTTQVIVDSNGDNQTIKFSRPATKYIWIRYTLTLYAEEELSANPETTIKNAVVAYAEEKYIPGKDVIKDRLSSPVYSSVTGIDETSIELALTALPTDTPSYGTVNIPIADREIASVVFNRITVLIP